ncbi:M14 family metallocarboxypeptidase [Shewanella sp. AS16]|uniref:M14 family metallopeptidase n=1 Tax=Shewanella sp. AS16 TaxID=2907625 RepID=UPI001F2664B0|nr:M14 family metallocarboxypeptidase [Shewanella sp. AS16]MCE9684879.1 M14 family metallocarboxypeptidase [Shewanella sp. AS16]
MQSSNSYPIGTPGEPWGDVEKATWLARAGIKRSYREEVLDKLESLGTRFERLQYGALSYDAARYPLLALKTLGWDSNKPCILITGGVHGYETSGVQGAIKFLDTQAENYAEHFNILVAPCVSPWGYETINRWNPNAVDPNRSFYAQSPAEESAALMRLVASLECDILAHIDLHETTDSDEQEFRPALAARDGRDYVADTVPDGFYLVGDSENPQPAFQEAIIAAVSAVTHIAPADADGKIIGEPLAQPGVINYPVKTLGLCSSLTHCTYGTTTEVYPDSPRASERECNDAQVAAIKGALDYILSQA